MFLTVTAPEWSPAVVMARAKLHGFAVIPPRKPDQSSLPDHKPR